eukprot:gene11742-13192_t
MSSLPVREVQQRAVLPDLHHITLELATKVYEPAEDTYLMCDALLLDIEDILTRQPHSLLEVGCGSGCVITYLSTLLKSREVDSFTAYGTDINPVALEVTRQTAERNHVTVQLTQTDLVQELEGRLGGQIDVMIFNPPYVPTPSEEIEGNGIEVSWAGGIDGREVIDRFLPKIPVMLSPQGVLYMVLVQENKPKQVQALLAQLDLDMKIVCKTKAVNEQLMIVKVTRKAADSRTDS